MQPAKILVADDEQNLRRVLVALLRREGHDVVQAASGLEAIERLAEVDVVITDLRMPGADGMEVLRTASKHHPHVPVIMITAYGSVGQAVEAIKAGVFDYEKGAFTGATSSKPGRFELADGGTLFLDEIGEIPVEMQVKLLRAIQESEFERVGGLKTIKVNVRLITATNRDLELEIQRGM